MTQTTASRRTRIGFRGRVLGLLLVLLIASYAVGLVVQRAVLLRRLDDEVATALDQERRELEDLASGRDPATGQPFAGDVRAIFETFLARNRPGEGEVYLTFVGGAAHLTSRPPVDVRLDRDPELVERWSRLTAGESGGLDTDAGPVEYLAVPLSSGGSTAGVFVVANFVQEERDEIADWIRVEAAVGAIVLLLGTAAAWLVAGRLLRPVRQVTETARTISETDLGRRIPVNGDDEVSALAATFNGMLDRLETAFTTQRAFVDDAGHELRTPITIVRGHLEVMGDDPQDRVETLALVTDELDRMARIVDDLLLLARAEQPDFLVPTVVDLGELTTDLLAKASALGERQWQLDAVASDPVRADPQRIAQAVLNLARNAVEHTQPGQVIALGSARWGDEVSLWVRDEGPGVAPEDRERIFERFSRGRRTRRTEGAGLGLAIAAAVATAHGGRITLDSDPGAGATFTVVLPATATSAARSTPSAPAPPSVASRPTEEPAWPAS